MLWSIIPKRQGHSKINQQVKKYLYNWILQHTQFLVSPIAHDCLKVSIDSQVGPQLVSKHLFWVLVKALHNIMVIPPEEGGLKEARYSENNSIISDSTIRNILPPQLNKMTSRYKVMCGCECCISTKSMHLSLLVWRNRCL